MGGVWRKRVELELELGWGVFLVGNWGARGKERGEERGEEREREREEKSKRKTSKKGKRAKGKEMKKSNMGIKKIKKMT